MIMSDMIDSAKEEMEILFNRLSLKDEIIGLIGVKGTCF